MSDGDRMRLLISRHEYDALMDIRGLESSAHLLVMLARPDASGQMVLEGPSPAFGALQNDLSDEIYHELSPPSRLKQLRRLYDRLAPDHDL
jgi:hypothetical protein